MVGRDYIGHLLFCPETVRKQLFYFTAVVPKRWAADRYRWISWYRTSERKKNHNILFFSVLFLSDYEGSLILEKLLNSLPHI